MQVLLGIRKTSISRSQNCCMLWPLPLHFNQAGLHVADMAQDVYAQGNKFDKLKSVKKRALRPKGCC